MSSATRPPLYLLLLFSFIGFADASYLAADHYFALPLPCSLTGGCDTVLRSAYATAGPVPLALLGVIYYLAILFLTVTLLTSAAPAARPAKIILGLTSLGLLASAYFVYLQFGVIRALCMYCLGSALTTLLLFAVALWLTARAKNPPPAEAK